MLANCPDREVRRGGCSASSTTTASGDDPGRHRGLAAPGRGRRPGARGVTDLRHVVPGVRFAVDAYVNFARRAPWQEAVCSSLTELFAPEIHQQRLATWPEHYPWIEPDGLQYFRSRVQQARRDVEQGLAITLAHFNTRALQERALEILQFKLDILWTMIDCMQLRYGLQHERSRDDRRRASERACHRSDRPGRASRGFRLQWEEAQDCLVLLYPEGMVKLNASAGEILKRCDGQRSVAAIVERTGERVRAPGPAATTCIAFVEMAARQRWLQTGSEASRRMNASLPPPASGRRCGCSPS